MKREKHGLILVYIICATLTVAAFFAKDFVLYDFHMQPSDYTYQETTQKQPAQAGTNIWFSYGADRELLYGFSQGIAANDIQLYARTAESAERITMADMTPIREDFYGNFIAALPAQILDADGDGEPETVYDFARADLGPHAYEPFPVRFNLPEIPFELTLFNRKYIQVYWNGQLLTEGDISVASSDGAEHHYTINHNGWIDGLPIKDIRKGFTATYSPDGETVYRMYYALEDYPYFSEHFFKAHLPLLAVLLLSAAGIVIVQLIRMRYARRDPAYEIYSREHIGFRAGNSLKTKTSSRFLLIRWLCLIAGMFLWTYAGKVINQGQALNEIAVPVLACPFNIDQIVETPCYYLSHLPNLFTRFGTDFPTQNLIYGGIFLTTLLICILFLGRILCGFLCPAGLLQDLMDKLRQALHIRPVTVSDRMFQILQPIKWIWIVLFLGFAFTGGDFCDICPFKVTTTAQGGFWTNLYLGGFLTVVILVGSFFIKRFWCLMCPMGYLMGLFHRFNLFKLKKDCTSCSECGACYEACPMRLRNIYTEREQTDVQTIDCLMCGECIRQCPENDALSMTFCGKPIYRASKNTFLSRYQAVGDKKTEEEQETEVEKP